jgi:hypothetical protein
VAGETPILEAMRDHLIAEGVVRDPDTVGPLPPLWLSPRDGLNAPDEGSKPSYRAPLLAGGFTAPGVPSSPKEGFLVRESVDVHFRSRNPVAILDLGEQFRRALDDQHNFQMGDRLIQQTQMTVPNQLIVQDEQGFRYRMQFLFTWQDPDWPAERGWG